MCLLCAVELATREHLYFKCKYSKECLQLLTQWLQVYLPSDNIVQWWNTRNKSVLQKQIVAAVMMSLIARLWYMRNTSRVEGYVHHPSKIVTGIKADIRARIKYHGRHGVNTRSQFWLDSIM